MNHEEYTAAVKTFLEKMGFDHSDVYSFRAVAGSPLEVVAKSRDYKGKLKTQRVLVDYDKAGAV